MYPDFTKYEQYLIAYYRSNPGGTMREALLSEAAYLLPVVIILGLAGYTGSWLLSASAVVAYLALKLRESLSQPAATEALASIIQKYDAVIEELNGKLKHQSPAESSTS